MGESVADCPAYNVTVLFGHERRAVVDWRVNEGLEDADPVYPLWAVFRSSIMPHYVASLKNLAAQSVS